MKHGVLKGILWHQGESDCNESDAELYEDRLVTLVNTLRMDLGMPDVPFMVAELGDYYVEQHPEARIINKALRQIPQRVEYTACVDSKCLNHKGDNVHFSAAAARELGQRYAEAMIPLQYAESAY